ncbi:MAG: hypothetical protein U0401_11995 [Anaerolineae bacterium]
MGGRREAGQAYISKTESRRLSASGPAADNLLMGFQNRPDFPGVACCP